MAHTKAGGKRTIRLPRKRAKVAELISEKQVAADIDTFDYNFDMLDTRSFIME